MYDVMVWLQQFRNPALDYIVEAITITAEENVLLIAICILYWCVSKKMGYVAGFAVVFSNNLSYVLKDIFKIPRPWLVDDRIIAIRQHTATGYSFPSGHTMSGSSLWIGMALCIKKRWFSILTAVMTLLIGLSRIYLSVHTPLDVGVGWVLAILVALMSYYLMTKLQAKGINVLFILLNVLLIAMLFIVRSETYYKMTGVLLAFLPSYLLERKFIRFNVKGRWWQHIIKVLLGGGIALGIRIGLSALFPEMLIFDFIRYFLMGVGILVLAPWLFLKLKLASPCEKA